MGKRKDDRTQDEMKSHNVLITATDRFLSGWGEATGGLSKCAWACKPEDGQAVYRWVKSRTDMKYVNLTYNKWYPRAAHVHIYVVNDNHPALGD